MGFAGFLGNALIAGGPGLALFCVFVAQRSFLLLLFLARYSSLCLYLLCSSSLAHKHSPGARHTASLHGSFH